MRLGVNATEWEFVARSASGLSVLIRSAKDGEIIREASTLVLRGKGYPSRDEALAEGYRWRDTLQACLALLGIGADFGDRAPSGGFTTHALEQMNQNAARPVVNEKPGLQVFECDPMPYLVSISPASLMTYNEKRSHRVLRTAAGLDIHYTEAERLAFDLYSASFFLPSPDARLLTLMMAVETLLDLEPRSAEARAHVDELIRLTKAANLSDSEKQSILGNLGWLYNESISQAGRRLSTRLGDRTYMSITPKKFFTECYEMRSRLVHGRLPRPDHMEIGKVAASLEVFVGHLLSSSLLASDVESSL